MTLRVALAVGRAAEIARAHPRHLVLLALLGGLLAFRAAPGVIAVLAITAGLITGVTTPGLLATSAVIAGAAFAQERANVIDSGPLTRMTGALVSGHVVLLESPRERARQEATARVRWLDGPARGDVGLARLTVGTIGTTANAGTTGQSLSAGDVLAVRARVAAFAPWEEFQLRRGVHAALDVESMRITGRRRDGPSGLLDAMRDRARAGLAPAGEAADAAVLRGMVLGEDQAIDDAVREEFERSGLAHLLAVSGQNVMLLSVLVLAAGSVVGASLRTRLLVALAVVVLYVPLTGAGPSIQRAGVMGGAGLVATLAGRPASRWYALILAACVTLALNPYAVTEPGWQLSFAAVIGLLIAAAPMTNALVRRGCPRAVAEATAITAVATVATAPLLAHHFEEISLVSLPANLIAAPAVAPVMWLGMLAISAAQIDPRLAAPLTALNEPLVAYIEWVAHVAAAQTHATVAMALPWPAGVLTAYAAAGTVALAARAVAMSPRAAPIRARLRVTLPDAGGPRRALVATACASLLVALLLGPGRAAILGGRGPQPLGPQEVLVSFLDVGQGDATLVQTDQAGVLFDTGPPDGPILRRLHEAGVKRLDVLILTHAQADHEGAALDVIARLRPRLVLNAGAGWPSAVQSRLSAAVEAAGGRVSPISASARMRFDGLSVTALWPPPRPPGAPTPSGDPNQLALVAHVEHGDFDLLLPADAESDVLGRLELPEVEALKVPHHGSEDPGLPAVLARLKPTYAAIEVGAGNSYGHPALTTLTALRAVAHVARTDRDGTVRLRVRDGRMALES